MQPLLKLCGNHSIDDTNLSLASSADYVGFVFAESKRQVTREQLKTWLLNRELKEKKLVALFVNETANTIQSLILDLPIDIIQCHGSETAKEIAKIKQVTCLPVWKAIHHNSEALQVMRTYHGSVDGYIVDCKVGNQWGGTGVSFDWTYIPAYLQEGRTQGVPVFIAGGIRPENIDQVLSYEPDGIDVSSGIEENGNKCNKLIKQLEERMNRV
ncbi:phosphoribosylanthranilate isomerase [Halalkalibacter alkalisediminis]|uniref:N-(5'-phosphoribosyl)anthranilate isomerase n=1 Tax=Halalkalibacter alkalisediminis TaxID=935616 RepID=A0ABV6NGJ6_9BACI|nr:phosphoribosylanthranilate isomerase [Halalkalibacter alkalisediminis]